MARFIQFNWEQPSIKVALPKAHWSQSKKRTISMIQMTIAGKLFAAWIIGDISCIICTKIFFYSIRELEQPWCYFFCYENDESYCFHWKLSYIGENYFLQGVKLKLLKRSGKDDFEKELNGECGNIYSENETKFIIWYRYGGTFPSVKLFLSSMICPFNPRIERCD